jgi:type I restriction enzyme S subunit
VDTRPIRQNCCIRCAVPLFPSHIVLREIRALPVPLPALDKQREIGAKLDVLQVKVDAMKALQGETAAERYAMPPAILDKAFKGEL